MGHGGPRNRGGRPPDPESLRSATRDFSAIALPREGFRGEAPAFPLPEATDRELEVWAEAWTTPQAAAWAQEAWRHRSVAQYVRWSVRMEQPDAAVGLAAAVMRLGDQIGLTPAGLRENGWTISKDQVAAKRDDTAAAPKKRAASRTSARDRFAVVDANAG